MPPWSRVVGILRRRLILGIIFSLSLLYCGVSLYSDKKGITHGSANDYSKSEILIDDNDNDLMEDDDTNIVSDKILWDPESIHDKDIRHLDNDVFDPNKTDSNKKSCQNSVQGRTLIVDDRGYVCARHDILPNGCCKTEYEAEKHVLIKDSSYCCKACNNIGCCAVYEYCVSCCLHPAKTVKLKKNFENDMKHKSSPKARKGKDILKMKMRNLDRYQICLAACRTSSASVRHENTYKDPNLKYCFITNAVTNVIDSQHLFRRDLISGNKNGDLSVVLTPAIPVNETGIINHFM